MTKAEQAVENHKSFMNCAASVLCAFADEAGLDKQAALEQARPMAGGRMGKCGAVLAAEKVLAAKYGASDARIAELERRFQAQNQSVMCRELKGGLTGEVLRSCRGCVTDAAAMLEQLLQESPADER